MKNKNVKRIFMITGIIFVIVIAYLVVNVFFQRSLLKKELYEITSMNLLMDNYDVVIKTNGNYAYAEKVIKKHYKKLSDNMKVINSYLTDEGLINILSSENLDSDKPKFEKSYKMLEEARQNITDSLEVIIDLCDEDTIKNLINRNKTNGYSYKLYKELMQTEEYLDEMAKNREDMQIIKDDLIIFLDKVGMIIELLNDNSDYWFIDEGQLYLETNNLMNQYNALSNDLNNFVSENLSKYKNDGSSNR